MLEQLYSKINDMEKSESKVKKLEEEVKELKELNLKLAALADNR